MELASKNVIIDGKYKGSSIVGTLGIVSVATGLFKSVTLDGNIISNYEVIEDDRRISAMSAVGRGAIGGLLLGPVGLLAAASAKKKGNHVLILKYKDGDSSLVSVDTKVYKMLLQKLSLVNSQISTDSEDIPDQIRKLAQLLEDGILTETEFTEKKEKLLAKI